MSASVGGPLGRPGDRFGQELADLLRPLDGHFESDHHCAEALEAITAQLAERVDFLKSELFDIVSRHHAVLGIEIHPAQEAGAAGDMTPAARMASAAGGALGSARAVESRALVLSKALQTLSWKADQSSSPAILRVPRAARAARLKARALNSAAAIIGLAARLHHLLAGASTALGTAMWVECALLLNRVEEYVTLHTALRARLVDIATRAVVVTERTLTPLDPPAHSSDIDALFAAASAALAQPLTRPAFCSVVQVTVHARLSGITTDPERTTALQDVLLALHLTQDLRPGAGPGLLSPPGPLQLPDLETTFTAAHLLAPLEASLPTPGDAVLRDLAGRLAGRAFPLAVGDPEARVFSAQAAPFVHVLTLVAPVRHLGLGPDGASIQQVAAPGPGADPRAVADDVAAGTVYERASAIVEFLQPLVAGPPSELVLGPGRPAGGPMPELSAAEGQLLSTRTSQRWAAAVWPVLVGALHQGPYTLLVEHFATEATGPGEDAPAAGDFASRAHTSAQQFESYLHLNGLLPRGPAECGATAGGPGAEVGAGAGAGAGAGSPRWPPGLAPGAPAPGPGVASSPAAAVASLSGWWQAPRFQARVRSARRTRLLDAARRDLLCGQAYGHEAVGGDCARPEGAARQQLLALLDDPAAAGAGPAVDRLLSVEQDLSPLAVSRRIRRLAVGHLVPLCLGLATGGSGAGPEDISAVLRDVVDLLRAHSVLRLRQVFEAAVSAGAGGGPPAEAQLRAQCEAAAREGALAHNDFLYVAWVLSCFGTPELPSPGSSARAGLASTSVAPLLVALCREAARSAYVQMMTLLGASVCESLVGVFRARTDVTSRGQAVRWHCALLEGVFTLWTLPDAAAAAAAADLAGGFQFPGPDAAGPDGEIFPEAGLWCPPSPGPVWAPQLAGSGAGPSTPAEPGPPSEVGHDVVWAGAASSAEGFRQEVLGFVDSLALREILGRASCLCLFCEDCCRLYLCPAGCEAAPGSVEPHHSPAQLLEAGTLGPLLAAVARFRPAHRGHLLPDLPAGACPGEGAPRAGGFSFWVFFSRALPVPDACRAGHPGQPGAGAAFGAGIVKALGLVALAVGCAVIRRPVIRSPGLAALGGFLAGALPGLFLTSPAFLPQARLRPGCRVCCDAEAAADRGPLVAALLDMTGLLARRLVCFERLALGALAAIIDDELLSRGFSSHVSGEVLSRMEAASGGPAGRKQHALNLRLALSRLLDLVSQVLATLPGQVLRALPEATHLQVLRDNLGAYDWAERIRQLADLGHGPAVASAAHVAGPHAGPSSLLSLRGRLQAIGTLRPLVLRALTSDTLAFFDDGQPGLLQRLRIRWLLRQMHLHSRSLGNALRLLAQSIEEYESIEPSEGGLFAGLQALSMQAGALSTELRLAAGRLTRLLQLAHHGPGSPGRETAARALVQHFEQLLIPDLGRILGRAEALSSRLAAPPAAGVARPAAIPHDHVAPVRLSDIAIQPETGEYVTEGGSHPRPEDVPPEPSQWFVFAGADEDDDRAADFPRPKSTLSREERIAQRKARLEVERQQRETQQAMLDLVSELQDVLRDLPIPEPPI
ncbi:hypothetical protein H696_02033 [Fonticula alba]|uniref:Uncharacterized protein n=1 Tax=Fonticula alba TaxID=691883 RepID=A0A058Z9W5_FONAL|nr:hypothetical protein H696_02033 [Fonticula alba]KCV71084.1 hypothetical protein H696_02033 [Fonticula alba]|eukprot:XP_009494207.1 hypothetical protein H696_02033 [Fonticula alba]